MFITKSLRAGALAAAVAGTVLLGLAPTASAATPDYSARNAFVVLTGGESTALNLCLNDARDGVINTQQNACNQIATAGNIVSLDNVTAFVAPAGGGGAFSGGHATVALSGGTANAVNQCVNDSKDGVINTQINNCNQYAVAGNLIILSGITVNIYL